jgi:hypothetical protein
MGFQEYIMKENKTILEKYLSDNFKNELYHIEYDKDNKTNFIQFRATLKKKFIRGFEKLVDDYTIVASYKSSANARNNYTLIVFFSF